MVKQFKIVLGSKVFYTLIAVLAVLLVGGIVYAYGSSTPAVMGHTAGELTGVCKPDGTDCPYPVFILCNWNGWRATTSFTIDDGAKYANTYTTTVVYCDGGRMTKLFYLPCNTAKASYDSSIDCSG